MAERIWRYGLTGDEWLHLAAEGDESEVGPCCGNISVLRENLNALATSQGDSGWAKFFSQSVLESYEMCRDGHKLANEESFPLLHRVLAGIRKDAMDEADRRGAIREMVVSNMAILNRLDPHLGCVKCRGPLTDGRCPTCQPAEGEKE